MTSKHAWNASELRVSKDRETLREKTVQRLREAILNQYFAPGDRLIERELCELTGVSRTSVREALRQLESEHLIKTIPNRGPVVASLTVEDARHIYEVREALEGLAGRLCVERSSDAEIDTIVRCADKLLAAIGKRDVSATVSHLDRFYDLLFSACANPVAASMSRTLRGRLHYLRATSTHRQSDARINESIVNYKRLVDAIKKRDADETADACVAQVRHAAAVAVELLAGEDGGDGAL